MIIVRFKEPVKNAQLWIKENRIYLAESSPIKNHYKVYVKDHYGQDTFGNYDIRWFEIIDSKLLELIYNV